MYKEILVALDSHKQSRCAISHAIELARAFGARLSLLMVIRPLSLSPWIADGNGYVGPAGLKMREDMALKFQEDMENLELFLQNLVTHAGLEGINASYSMASGKAGRIICDYAKRIGADLIVMTPLSPTGFWRWFMGSVAEDVMSRIRVPVLIVNSPVQERDYTVMDEAVSLTSEQPPRPSSGESKDVTN